MVVLLWWLGLVSWCRFGWFGFGGVSLSGAGWVALWVRLVSGVLEVWIADGGLGVWVGGLG